MSAEFGPIPFVDFKAKKPSEMAKTSDGNLYIERLPFPLPVEEVRLADIRGQCGGVRAAIQGLEQVVEIVAGREQVYVWGQLVHNKQEVERFNGMGVVNVDRDMNRVPDGSLLVTTAHGSPDELYQQAAAKNLTVIDTTCKLVTAVERAIVRSLNNGLSVDYFGKNGHPETEKMKSVARRVAGDSVDSVFRVIDEHDDPEAIIPWRGGAVFLSQTTMSTDEFAEVQDRLNSGRNYDTETRLSICGAADKRQHAVGVLVESGIDLLIINGSENSHNSRMMAEKGRRMGVRSYLIDGPGEINPVWFNFRSKVVGISSGASVSDQQTDDIVRFFRIQGVDNITTIKSGLEESSATFSLPTNIRKVLEQRYAA